jgi:hypothetical protein
MKTFIFPHYQFNTVNNITDVENYSVISFDIRNIDSGIDLIEQYAYAQSKLISSLDGFINSTFSGKIDNSSLIDVLYAIMKINEAKNNIRHEINVLKNDVLPHIKDNADSEEHKRCNKLEIFINVITHPTKGDSIDLNKIIHFIKFCYLEVSPNFIKEYMKNVDFYNDIHNTLPN